MLNCPILAFFRVCWMGETPTAAAAPAAAFSRFVLTLDDAAATAAAPDGLSFLS
jgi:hypothetical protein